MFTPLNLPNLAAWFDPTDPMYLVDGTTPVTTTSDTVSVWPDKSGNAKVLTPLGTGAKFAPTGINGRRAVNFASNSYFRLAGFLTAANADALTIFIVAKTATGAVAALKLLFGTSTPNFWTGPTAANGIDLTYTGPTVAGSLAGLDGQDNIYMLSIGPTTLVESVGRLARGGNAGGLQSSMSTDINAKSGSQSYGPNDLYIGSQAASASFAWDGLFGDIIICNGTLSSEDRRLVKDYLSAKYGYNTEPFLCLFGNSLTSGTGSTSGATQKVLASGDNLPSLLLADLTGAKVMVDATPGRTITAMATECPSYGFKFVLPSTGAKHVALVWECTNDLITGTPPQDPTATYNKLVAFCQAAKAAGYTEVAVGTILPRQDNGTTPYANFETDRLAVNALIVANYASFADGLIDFAADARLSDPTNTTYFHTDKIHLNTTGYGVAKTLALAVVQPMLGL